MDDAEAEALEILAEVDEDTKKLLMGFQMEEFFLDCQYAGSTCHMEYVPPPSLISFYAVVSLVY